MSTIPTELLVGAAYGLAAGTVAAIAIGLAAIAMRIATDREIPPVVGAAAGLVVGGALFVRLGLVDVDAIARADIDAVATQVPRLAPAAAVVCLLSLYATGIGTRIGSRLPRTAGLPTERGEPLAADAVDALDALGQVAVRPAGEVETIDGYPPLPPALRRTLETGSWRLPADLPLSELESRLERRLRTQYDLAAISVSIDRRGRATIAAAPPASGVAGDVPDGWRAVSVSAVIPTELAPGDEVDVLTTADTVSGTVLAVGGAGDPSVVDDDPSPAADGTRATEPLDRNGRLRRTGNGSSGGVGRVTVCVPAADAAALLHASSVRLVVRGRATSPDAAALSMLERAGSVVRHLTLGTAAIDAIESGDVELLAAAAGGGGDTGASADRTTDRVATGRAVDGASEWRFAPIDAVLEPGTEAFVAGDAPAVESLIESATGEPAEVGR